MNSNSIDANSRDRNKGRHPRIPLTMVLTVGMDSFHNETYFLRVMPSFSPCVSDSFECVREKSCKYVPDCEAVS
jgi:hypothetical protein